MAVDFSTVALGCLALLLAMPLMATSPGVILPAESLAYRRTQLAAPELLPQEKLAQYARYDFGPLWTESNKNGGPYGFIGPKYQRLRVRILSVQRDVANPARYRVTGKTQVFGYVSAFAGTLELQHVREVREPALGLDETVSPASQEGMALAAYEFRENPAQPKNGIFRGIMQTKWYLNTRGRLCYDSIRNYSDGYCNNQFVGTWTGYKAKQALRCNWGDGRIPNSGSLDVGAGEFIPDPKYHAAGWQAYAEPLSPAAKAAQPPKNSAWWQ